MTHLSSYPFLFRPVLITIQKCFNIDWRITNFKKGQEKGLTIHLIRLFILSSSAEILDVYAWVIVPYI